MTQAPYGSWKSPITTDLVVSKTVGLVGVRVDGDRIFWLEGRAEEKGRCVIVMQGPDGVVQDVTPAPFYVRTRVHEYGGGAWTVHDGEVFFSNFPDGRLYRQVPGQDPVAVTPEAAKRYGAFSVDASRGRVIAVREDHSRGEGEPTNEIVAIDLASGEATVLVTGQDFYTNPRLSPDGRRLAWLTWNHPDMPWNGTELWLADLDEAGRPTGAKRISGSRTESVACPEFSPSGRLYFVTDLTGWWNLHTVDPDGTVRAVHLAEAEFARPQWILDATSYAFLSEDEALVTWHAGGRVHLGRLDLTTGALTEVSTEFESFDSAVPAPDGDHAYAVVGSAILPTRLARIDLRSGSSETIRLSSPVTIDEGYLSRAESITFPTTHDRTAHAFYYPPRNRDHEAPPGELPPLLVKSHGGPTSATSSVFRLSIQYWTSRGFAVVDVNYSGSTGFGRAYRDRLAGTWGTVDVEDCEAAARHLVEQGRADPDRLAITGGSAGGYTTLCALAFTETFRAGASHFGICDLEVLARDTHKFESRYLDYLIGPYPEMQETYRERSPIHHVEGLSCPAIFFQGLLDEVVPPNQAELMVDALRQKGVPVAYVPFPEEHHGFRIEANIRKALEGEFYFYSRVFGFQPADDLEPVEIENMDPASAG